MTLAAAIFVELNTSSGRSAGDVADRYSGAYCVDVNGASPEIASICGGEYIHFTAGISQIHFQPVARGKTRAGEMQHHEFGSCGCRCVGKIDSPGVGTRW